MWILDSSRHRTVTVDLYEHESFEIIDLGEKLKNQTG
jgi:hypothetical protein